MAVTILEALQNANYNLETVKNTGMYQLLPMVSSQLKNATTLLEKGYSPEDEVEPLLEKFGNVDDVPDKD